MPENTMLAELLKKEADVLRMQEETKRDMSSALAEVRRQIHQCLTGGNIHSGDSVTKSGKDG